MLGLALTSAAPLAGATVAERIRGQRIAETSPPLENPTVRPAAAATHMRDEDVVLGVTLAGRARAYPWWIAKNYHVVDDTLGGKPVAIAFCEQCTGAAAFSREVDGHVLSFDVPGIYNGTIVLRDRETRTLWAPFSGRALEGPLVGRRLERVPLALTHWDEWLARHPETDVVWDVSGKREGHGAWYRPGKWGIVSEMGQTLETWDPRLPENALVMGVEAGAGAESRAYPLATLRSRPGAQLEDQVGPTPVLVSSRGALEAAAFDRTVRGRVLRFRAPAHPEDPFTDVETGSAWSGEGIAVDGPLRGEALRRLDGYLVEWHVWSAYHPRTEVFGSGAAPSLATNAILPSLRLRTLTAATPQAVPLTGDLNLVAVWAAWCPPCRVEMPVVQELARRFAGRGLAAVGIAVHIPEDEEREVVRRFVAEARIAMPIFLVDDAAYDVLDAVSRDAGRPGLILPTVFVADGKGQVLAVFSGNEVDGLERFLESRLAPSGGRSGNGGR